MRRCLTSALLLGILGLSACGKSTPTLSLLVWEGYADPSFVHGFEVSDHCKVSASYMGSSDELVAKLRGGSASNYDVISPSSDVATMIAATGLAVPLDLSRLPSYRELSPKLTSLPLVHVNGKVYGVPFMWGPNPLLYDTTVYPQPPDSWSILWNPKYRGKVSVWDDLSTVYMAAQVLGYDHPDPNDIYNLSDAQLEQVKQKLLELKPNIRKIWSTGGELTNLFENHEIVLAMGWPLNTNQLRKAGFPIGETIPKENTTGWIDHLMITAASDHKNLAYQFLQYMIEPKTQKMVSDVTLYVPANPLAAQYMTEEQKQTLHLNDVDAYQKRIYFWENVPRRAKYNEIWNEVKAAPLMPANATLLSLRDVVKRFGSTPVLRGICLDVAPGEFLTILGETGSGKTTLLRLVAGFEQPDAGEIWMADQRLDTLPPYRRRVNTVFQSYALFPHLTVFDNVAYGLKAQKSPRREIRPRVDEALALVKMSAFAQRLPAQLSGGQQQRVALARALVNRPQLLLLDEPLSALDASLRHQVQTELKLLQREVGITFVFVTHDQDEALALSDRIALLRAGNIEQLATPREIYLRPGSQYAARFIGKTNLLKVTVSGGGARGSLCWPAAGPDGDAAFSLRPESIRLVGPAPAGLDGDAVPTTSPSASADPAARFRATVRSQAFGGASDLVEVEDPTGLRLLVRIPCAGPLEGAWEFSFSGNDAVRLNDEPRHS